MPPLFDAYLMVDWSAANVPATGADSVWIASAERRDDALTPLRLVNPSTRRAAVALLADLLSDLTARDRVSLVGFDFAFGYPSGFARRLRGEEADWRKVWKEVAARVRDGENNANNRFEVAAALNQRISGGPFPFWGCPATAAGPLLSPRKSAGFDDTLAELRLCDSAAGGSHPVWKLAYPGCVGSQTLLGIAHLHALRHHPWLAEVARVWPFETGLRAVQRPGHGGWRVLFAEIYPSIFDSRAVAHEVKDARQVQAVVEQVSRLDEAGRLAALFAGPPTLTAEQRLAIETEEGWILGIETTGRRPDAQAASATPGRYDYVRQPDEIYRRSFAAIRAEADLSSLPADLEPLAVRLVHAAGDPGIVGDLAWTGDAAAAGRRALAGGASILVDTEMVAAGIIRARLPAENAVVCTLAEPGLAPAAQAIGNTRSAAAVDRWRDRLEGAVVAIGNAPTALFRLLELLDAGAPRPAVILGFPVGFVGAAEVEGGADRAPRGRAVRHPARPARRQRFRRGRRQCARRGYGVNPWLTVIGIGDDGLAGLSPAARALVGSAELLVGGERHHAMIPASGAERLTWEGGVHRAAEEIARWRGRRVVVLATGDPMWYGGGANLARTFGPDEMAVIPYPGAFSLAASRMLWPLADVECVTVHGRPLQVLNLHIQPGARLLVLSRDGDTPRQVAALLTARGFGPSVVTVLEHLGGAAERRLDGVAERWRHPRAADLSTLAIDCRPGPAPRLLPPVPGLPDELFESDGQLTKREVRAATIAALAPLPGQTLWDIGAGSGSVAIEWLRAVPRYRTSGGTEARAIAVERDAGRCACIARNAAALGVPQIEVVNGDAPDALGPIEPRPDTIFLGGGVARPGLLDRCWDILHSGGRLVANAVSLEATARLIDFRRRHGGDLTRLAVSRAGPMGKLSGFRALMEVTQYVAVKRSVQP